MALDDTVEGMMGFGRREFISMCATLGAASLWARRSAARSTVAWRESRTDFPQGVASGDPDEHSVVLWTRRPLDGRDHAELTVEVARDPAFRRVVATSTAPILAVSDWTCRALVGGLQPSTVYWYRFTDETGAGSRIGRTVTAPRSSDPREVRFAFVCCQSVNEGAQNAYRRMIWEDERAAPDKRLGFVLHLGDFIYEIVEYPEEVSHRLGRTVFDIGKVPDSRKVGNFHAPTTLDGYRTVYRAHIDDEDVQDARATFPFICIGDNHEFSGNGWQSFTRYADKVEPAQRLRVAANQAWWEYIPSRVRKASGPHMDRFDAPDVRDAPVDRFDDHGLGMEANNLAAIGSMTSYRAVRYGRHVDLIMTDLHSYTMEDPTDRPEAAAFDLPDFPMFFPQEAIEILDAGRTYADHQPPSVISIGDTSVPNYRKDEPAFTVLGREQKAWLKERLEASTATWKIWGATNGTLDMRTDPQNLPAGLTKPWPGSGYATFGGGDFSSALTERAEVYDLVKSAKVEGFVTVAGDRHSFWAGYASKALPPHAFDPVGIAFITAAISSIGLGEALEHRTKKHPLNKLFVADFPGGAEDNINLLLKHGVRSALAYAATGDVERARAATNPDVAPHLEFVDMGGHGYSVVTANAKTIDVQFVCIARPVSRADTPDGGPLRYRVSHRAERWHALDKPRLQQTVIDGNPKLSV